VRNKSQLSIRLHRIELANALLKQLQQRGDSEGAHVWKHVVMPFAREKDVEVFEVWKAWDILKEAGRRVVRIRGTWTILSFEPLEFDADGEILSREGNR